MTTGTIHIVPAPGSALTALGMTFTPGRLYQVTRGHADAVRDDTGDSWVEHLGDDEQRHRWGRKLLQVVEVETARPGATLARLRAIADAPFEGLGLLRAGDELVMTVELVRQLGWLQPHVQLATHGHQVFGVETLGDDR